MAENRVYVAIDLKSFYASVECIQLGYDPLKTNLVVADESRTEKTICLAVSPSLKSYGIPGRARLFEVIQRVNEVNSNRRVMNNYKDFVGSSVNADELKDNMLSVDFVTAPPRMSLYMKFSTMIYQIYLKYVAPEDIHVYSIDEVFIDITDYLKTNNMTPREMAMAMVNDVFYTTGITATAGIGTNMYLCKIAMDIVAKHMPADENGVRIAELDEMSYRKELWDHKPITDFWRVGKGIAKRLADNGMFTMGDVARCSLGAPNSYHNEDLLYKIFGINAELLIDHAWGWEPCRISDVKGYMPENTSISSGQVLSCPYEYDKARIVVREMVELLALDLVDKGLVTDQIVLTVGYDIDNIKNGYKGEVTTDHYGRAVPKQAHGTGNIGRHTSSTRLMAQTTMELFDRIVDKDLLVRRMYVVANHIIDEPTMLANSQVEQLDLFTDYEKRAKDDERLEKERSIQKAMLDIQRRFGKNAILKGMNLQEGATTIERNGQVGGHKA